jgi:hypothetical protein
MPVPSWQRRARNAGEKRGRQLKHRLRHERVRALIISLKDGPCADCGGRFHFAAMDFDHRPGTTKVASIADITTVERLRAEVAKCDLVCANCHRVRTFNRLVSATGSTPVDPMLGWSNTTAMGVKVSATHCSNWTTAQLAPKGRFGETTATTKDWTDLSDPSLNPLNCGASLHLYCFQHPE